MKDERAQARSERNHDPSRLLALSDGVFAIILTLLVLELQIPELSNGEGLREALRETRPSFIAFLISFVVVAMAWAGHRDLFNLIRRTDRVLIWLNLLLLLPLSILPFGASILSRYDREPTALKVFGLILIAISLMRLTIWVYAIQRPYLLFEPIDKGSGWMGMVLVLIPMLAYSIAIVLSDSAPSVSLAIYAVVPFTYLISVTFIRKTAKPGASDEDFT